MSKKAIQSGACLAPRYSMEIACRTFAEIPFLSRFDPGQHLAESGALTVRNILINKESRENGGT